MASPTLQTIADATGVSRMTVSRALRDDPSIPVVTRKRIRTTAEKLGYRPDPLVSALMTRVRASRPRKDRVVLAYVTTYPSNSELRNYDYIQQMQLGASQHAEELGFHLEEFNLSDLRVSPRRLGEILRARGIRGVLVAPMAKNGRLGMDFSGFAASAIGSSLLRPELHRAQSHHAHNLGIAFRELRHRGYRRLGLVLDVHGDKRTEHMLAALSHHFQASLKKEKPVPPLIVPQVTQKGVTDWAVRHKPEVILSFTFNIAWWLSERSEIRPKFLNLNWCANDGSDFGIDQQPKRLAAAAVDLISEQLVHNRYGLPESPKTIMLDGKWVVSPKPG